MEINNNITSLKNEPSRAANQPQQTNQSFKGCAVAVNAAGGLMQWIEEGGFLLSFLIQDFLGMTCPRTFAGFLRDKDKTGEYNIQEGFEVLGREGLSGPVMMAVAPISFLIAAKCGKSTGINSQFIKKFGNSLKEIISANNFDRKILNDKNKFKEEFYKKNIKSMLEQSFGKDNIKEENIEYILKKIDNYENIPEGTSLKKFRGKARYRKQCLNEISEYIDNIRYNTNCDLDYLQKVRFGSDSLKDYKIFNTKNAIEAMVKYSNDAITANRHFDKLDEAMAESIKNKSLTKRLIANISTMAATLGVLSVLPKIYARNDVAPGAREYLKNRDTYEKNGEVNFKGKEKPAKGILERIGKFLNKINNDFVSSELEYNGHNFTNTLMTGLATFGLITPRIRRANKRAQVDENGKKDRTEMWEILIRDITSTLAVVFAVPMMTRAFITSIEKKTGFVLMQKDRSMNKLKTTLDLINPYSKAHVLTNSEINSLYSKVDSQAKMMNFCKYIDKNGGDLEKIISKSEKVGEVFNEKTFKLDSIKNKSKAEKNKEIISFFEKLEENVKKLLNKSAVNKENSDKIVKDLMTTVKPGKNPITRYARGWNSLPAAVATVFVVPYILGWVIPRLTYKNTRRIHEKSYESRATRV